MENCFISSLVVVQSCLVRMSLISLTGLEDESGVVCMLRRRSKDTKINVRKASVSAIENVCRLETQNVNEQVMSLLDM